MSSLSDRQAAFARLRGQLDVRSSAVAGNADAERRVLATGVAAIDDPLSGGLSQGAITELVCAAPSCGSQLWLALLLAAERRACQRVALVDACDAFDPTSHEPDLYRHLVWIRCPSVPAAMQAADLVTRDANFGLVVLDLKHADARELRQTPATLWYRLQRAVEPSHLALLVITRRATVPSAQLRLELTRSFTLADCGRERAHLAAGLAPVMQRQRRRAVLEATAG
jgi:RecA/RadA recombinase